MKAFYSFIALFLFTGIAGAQTNSTTMPATTPVSSSEVLDVWPDGKMPGKGADEPEQEVPSKGDNVRRITNVSHPTLALFRAPKGVAPAPVVVVCPGGGYGIVVMDKEGSEIATWLNSAGITALVLKYRVPGNREGALQDLQRALSLVRAHAADWNIDPRHVGVIGFSAGGNLAAKSSLMSGKRTYAALDAVDQQSCLPDVAMLVYPAYLAKDGKVATDLDLKANIPPTLVVHTEDDEKFIEGSKLYAAALRELKAPVEFLLYSTGGHGYGLRCKMDAKEWPKAALDWLHRTGFN